VPLGGASRLLAAGAKGGASGSDDDGDGAEGGGGGLGGGLGGGSGSEDEGELLQDKMRMAFISKQQQPGGRRDGAYATTVADTEEDEAFAAEQLRKAIRKNRGGPASTSGAPTAAGAAAAAAAAAAGHAGAAGSGGAGSGAAGRSRLAALAATGTAAVQAVADALARAKLGQKQAKSNLERTGGHLNNALESIDKTRVSREEGRRSGPRAVPYQLTPLLHTTPWGALFLQPVCLNPSTPPRKPLAPPQSDIQSVGDKYAAVQQLRSYCADLCECLAAKAALGEELEDHLVEMREDRGRAAAAARRVRGLGGVVCMASRAPGWATNMSPLFTLE
jgi:GC-rich sequence DNA-binding factor